MALDVIGAGLPRTATLSLKMALEQLGFSPCHHMVEMFDHPETWDEWKKAFDGQAHDWAVAMPGFRACVDAPSCFLYRDLAETYPDAKIVLSTRDAENWLRSVRATVGSAENRERMAASAMAPVAASMFEHVQRAWPGLTAAFHDGPDADALAAFEAWHDEVRGAIAPGRLLVFEAKQGWAPLCAFLDVPVPDTSFPRANSTEEFAAAASRIPGAD